MFLNELTIKKAHEGLKKKQFSCEELTETCLKAIENKDQDIGAFITVLGDEAIKQARITDKDGNFDHTLTGVPLAIKDNMNIQGVRTTVASKILENYIAPYDATVVSKLKEQGSVFLGKANMDEFACGSSTETSFYKKTKNPHDLKRVPGGSSGGSVAAVASHQCIASLGSDTGGSIRQPAALCGTVGFKPTYGRVSRHGLLAMASSLDQIGPITKTVEDASILYEALAGNDINDSTTSLKKVEPTTDSLSKSIKGLRIGVPKEYLNREESTEGLDEGVREKTLEAIKKLEGLGAHIDDTVTLPHAKYSLPVYYIIMPSELSSNLGRFDGQRFGFSDRSGETLMDIYKDSRGEGFGEEIRRRIMLGTYTLSAGFYDAYYKRAQKVRTLIIEDFLKAYKNVDILVTPTTPTVAFKIGEKSEDPLSMYLSDIYTVSANISGVPAISVPCGSIKPLDGTRLLPVGLQIMGKHFDERTVLNVAFHLARALAE